MDGVNCSVGPQSSTESSSSGANQILSLSKFLHAGSSQVFLMGLENQVFLHVAASKRCAVCSQLIRYFFPSGNKQLSHDVITDIHSNLNKSSYKYSL